MPVVFLRIRFMQILRELLAAGLIYSVILIGSLIGLLYFFYHSQSDSASIIYWFSGIVLLLLMIHFNRSDHRFLKITVGRPWLICFVEYASVLLIFILLSFFASGIMISFIFIIPVLLLSILSPKPVTGFSRVGNVYFISSQNYEWKAGIRKSGIAIGLIMILALLLTPVPYASMILVWFMLLTISSFYEQHETREMVTSYELDERRFLIMKMWQQSGVFLLLVLPVMILSLTFFPDRWWIWLFFVIFSLVNIGVFVLSKYAIWEPGETHRSGSLINSLCLVSFFVPFLLPLPLFVLIRNYSKAVHRLNPVLHDYHQ